LEVLLVEKVMKAGAEKKASYARVLENVAKAIVLSLWTLIVFFMFAACLVRTVDVVPRVVLSFNHDSILVNVLVLVLTCAVLLAVTAFAGRVKRGRAGSHMENAGQGKAHVWLPAFLIALAMVLLVVYVLVFRFSPVDDSVFCFAYAQELLVGAYGAWQPLEYMGMFPFQNGIVLFDALLLLVFGDGAYIAFQIINVLAFGVVAYCVWRGFLLLFPDAKKNLLLVVLLFDYPVAAYVVFCYGIMIGMAFAFAGLLMLLKYYQGGKAIHGVLSAILVAFAMFFKSNYAIIAVGMVLLYVWMSIRKRRFLPLVFAIMVIVASIGVSRGTSAFVEGVTGVDVGSGIPKLAWVLMGLHDDGNNAGWWDGFNELVYTMNNGDAELVKQECRKGIVERIAVLVDHKKLVHFVYQKITSEWNNPTYECFYFQVSPSSNEQLAKLVTEPGYEGFKKVLNIVQTIIYFGWVLYAVWQWRHFRECNLFQLTFMIMMIGGFLFFAAWEAKCQYIMPFYYICVPYAVLGWQNLITFLYGKCKKMLNAA
jgi:hypothetical protein